MDLTIIIPTRKRSSSVIECILALEHNDADILVVDDASAEPVALPRHARVIRLSRPRGRSACINTGLKVARHDTVLILDDDIYAAPDMVIRLMNQFSATDNRKLALTPRVTWDPDVPVTLTMQWMERVAKFPSPMLLSRSFILEHGGYDENFTRGLQDTELKLRLKQFGLEVRRVDDAVGFQNNIFKIRTLVEREFMEGVSSVFLHSKFPDAVPQVNEVEKLIKNESQASDAETAVDEIALMEQAGAQDIPTGLPDLFVHVCRHYFLHGILEGLKDIGGIKSTRDSSSTVAIYKQAAHLEDIGEFDEARRLFRLVLHRPDQQYWDRAEYHLGSIELRLGNSTGADFHFNECLRLNPTNNKARRALNEPAHYHEVEPNVFERVAQPDSPKILFILFGDLGHVVNAFPVLTALEKKFGCETAWLTSPDHASLARASDASEVYETKTPGIIPWDWINTQGFTHVFFPEPGANHEEWEASGLDPIDFIARKCRVELNTRRPKFASAAEMLSHAEEFMRKHGLRRNAFITTAHGDIEKRRWPLSNLTKFVQNVDFPTVVFARNGDPQVPNTVTCFDTPLELMAVLIGWSRFYLGPANGSSWLATMTETPMAVFFDPRQAPRNSFVEMLRGEKKDIQEWNIFTNLQTVLDHVEYIVSQTTGAR